MTPYANLMGNLCKKIFGQIPAYLCVFRHIQDYLGWIFCKFLPNVCKIITILAEFSGNTAYLSLLFKLI